MTIMMPISNESDIELQLYFLDCEPNSIVRLLNDKSIMDHLLRTTTTKIIKFEKQYQRKEAHRVTDIDQVSLSDSPSLYVPIEITKMKHRNMPLSISPSASTTRSSLSSIEIQTENKAFIPRAPPLPDSFDLAIKSQLQSLPKTLKIPGQQTLWSNVKNYEVAEYFNELTSTPNQKNSHISNVSKTKTILDDRKSYNIGMYYVLM
ncbi:unnamed protein product [Rotaria socialis]|uniref:Uncharacterized protein n=2 Tax=Rotaria socialis TaxID=392032 RepID=A0A817URD4_9BILA|nr:unnamed protein product [Rotaria socialis]